MPGLGVEGEDRRHEGGGELCSQEAPGATWLCDLSLRFLICAGRGECSDIPHLPLSRRKGGGGERSLCFGCSEAVRVGAAPGVGAGGRRADFV